MKYLFFSGFMFILVSVMSCANNQVADIENIDNSTNQTKISAVNDANDSEVDEFLNSGSYLDYAVYLAKNSTMPDKTMILKKFLSLPLSIQTKELVRANCAIFTSDSRILITGSSSVIAFWNVENIKKPKLLKLTKSHKKPVTILSLSHDNRLLASGSEDREIKIHDISDMDNIIEVSTMKGHKDSITALAFSPDDKALVSGSEDALIKFWVVSTGKCMSTLDEFSYEINSLCLTSDGDYLFACSSYKTMIWEVKYYKEFRLIDELSMESWGRNRLCITPNGKNLIISSDQEITVWDITYVENMKKLKKLIGHDESINSIAVSRDGKFLVSGEGDYLKHGLIKLWDIENYSLIRTYEGHSGDVDFLSVAPNNKFIASCSRWGSIKIWATEKYLDELLQEN